MDCLAYAKECLAPIRKQFLKRGYFVVDEEPSFKRGPQLDSNVHVVIRADILLQDHVVGLIRINFHRWTRARQIRYPSRDLTNGGNPIRNQIEIEVVGYEYLSPSEFDSSIPHHPLDTRRVKETKISTKSSSFFRGIPGQPGWTTSWGLVDAAGNKMKGKPKIRKWAAHAAKEFAEKFLPRVVSEVADHVMES